MTVFQNEVLHGETDRFLDFLEDCSRRSLIDEVSATPKPGLVDRSDSGAHRDMDLQTFLDSTFAIVPFIRDMAKEGCSYKSNDPKKLFSSIRPIGILAEQSMFHATRGVNTHKGIIFSMGLAAAAAGFLFGRKREGTGRLDGRRENIAFPGDPQRKNAVFLVGQQLKDTTFPDGKRQKAAGFCLSPESVLTCCRAMCSEALERDFTTISKPRTHGEQLYLTYGCRGIRGEAAAGFPSVREVGLPALGQALTDTGCRDRIDLDCSDQTWNTVCLQVLLHLMAEVEDSNILYRSDCASLLYVKEQAARTLELGGSMTGEGMEALRSLNRDFIRRNLSPGGCADLLSLTLFLWRLKHTDFDIKE